MERNANLRQPRNIRIDRSKALTQILQRLISENECSGGPHVRYRKAVEAQNKFPDARDGLCEDSPQWGEGSPRPEL